MPSSDRESPEQDRNSTDLPPHIRREFLIEAGLLNLAILVTGVGLLLFGLTESTIHGALLAMVGASLLVVTGWRYRRHAPP